MGERHLPNPENLSPIIVPLSCLFFWWSNRDVGVFSFFIECRGLMTGCYFSFSFRWTTRKFRLSWWSFIWEAKQPWVIRGNLTFRHTHTQESQQKLLLKTQPERLMTLQDKYSFRSGTGIVPAFAKQGPAEHCEPTRHQSTMAVQQLCVCGWLNVRRSILERWKGDCQSSFFSK